MDPAALRAAFPVMETRAYLNAGTDGPVPAAGVAAAAAELEREAAEGRDARALRAPPGAGCRDARGLRRPAGLRDRRRRAHHLDERGHRDGARRAWTSARATRSSPATPSTPASTGRSSRRARTRRERAHRAVRRPGRRGRPETRLVACSHVSWVTGELAPAELADLDVPVVLDGAQGLGAVPLDVRALGCAAYAAAGQKWLCGPDGTRDAVRGAGVARAHRPDAARLQLASPTPPRAWPPSHKPTPPLRRPRSPAEALAFLDAATGTWASSAGRPSTSGPPASPSGWRTRCARAAPRWPARPRRSWPGVSPTRRRRASALAEQGIVVRDLPGRGLLRASVGAWNDEGDLERLLEAL